MTEAQSLTSAPGSRAQKTIERILDAVAELLLEEGFAGLNTNAAADRAGVNISTLYSYFSNKYELLEGLTVRMRQLTINVITTEFDENANKVERLNTLIDRGMQARIDHPWMVALEEALMASPRMSAMWSRQKVERASQIMQRLDLHKPGVSDEQMRLALTLAYENAISAFRLALTMDEARRRILLDELKLNLNTYLDHYR